jgi:hypothetical protein
VPASPFVPARSFAPVQNIPNWTDLKPRLGVAYDLFGTSRTAIRASVGRYVESIGTAMPAANNPITTSVTNTTRTWHDPAFPSDVPSDGLLVPNCDLQNPAANGNCGAINNQNFGMNNPGATSYAGDVLQGFNSARGAMWDISTEVQHQLLPGVSVTGGWYRNWAVNFRAFVTCGDDWGFQSMLQLGAGPPNLPNGGGYQVCGLYDIAPQKFGQALNLVTRASNFYAKGADVTCVNQSATPGTPGGVPAPSTCGRSDFFSVNVDTRLRGIRLGGGVDTGRTVNDSCFVVNSPQQLLNCHQVHPFSALTQIKIHGSYPLPAGFSVSGVLQNLSGTDDEANYSVPNAQIAPSLGRNLAACGAQTNCTATAVVPLYAPFTRFEPRLTLLDLRV